MPGACKSSPVDRPLFRQGPVFPAFIYVAFPISWCRPSLAVVREHSVVLDTCSSFAKAWGRETAKRRVGGANLAASVPPANPAFSDR